jgi:hypothetical protein
MNEFNFEKYRSAWKDEGSFGNRSLCRDEIDAVLNRESKDTSRQYRVGLVTDMVIKGVGAAALLGLLWLFRDNPAVSWLNTIVLAFTLFLVFVQWKTYLDIPPATLAGTDLRHCLQAFIRFYREQFVRSLYVAAVSGSLVFYIGILYYSWFRYGGIRPLDSEDYAVFITGLLLAFGINAVAQRWQFGFHVRELEACLREIDAETLSEQKLRKQRFRQLKVRLMWLVWAVLGILVLAYFLAR